MPHIRKNSDDLTQQNIAAYYKEGMAVANFLKQYQPEALFIEWDKDKNEDFKRDIQIVKNHDNPKFYTEFHFAAIPLAVLLNIDIYSIDDNNKEERKKLQNCAEKILKESNSELYQYALEAKHKHQKLKMKQENMLKELLHQTDDVVPLEQYFYLLMQAGDIGLKIAHQWSDRNYKMASNIIQESKNLNIIMVFTGKSHSRYLRHILSSTRIFDVTII